MREQVVELIKEMRIRGLVAEANQLASITKIAGHPVMTAQHMSEEKEEGSTEDVEDKDDKCPRIGAMAKDALKMVMERVDKDLDDEALEELEEDLYDEIKSVLDIIEEELLEKDDTEKDDAEED